MKFWIYLAAIIAAIITINKLDWSFDEWCIFFSVLFVLRLLRLAFKRPSGSWINSLSNFAAKALGGEINWWDTRLKVASEDYFSGTGWSILYKWAVTILGGLAAIYLTFKGIIWVLSQKVFWIIIGSIVAFVIVLLLIHSLIEAVKEKKAKAKEAAEKEFQAQCATLIDEFINIANIPMPAGAINHDNYDYCKTVLQEIISLTNSLGTVENDTTLKRALVDKKLEVFYVVSLCAQAKDLFAVSPEDEQKLLSAIDKAITDNNFNALRDSSNKCEDCYEEFNKELDNQEALLEDNKMAPFIEKLKATQNIDTTNFLGLTSSSKLAEKTQKLREIYEAAVAEYAELDAVRKKINYLLDWQRVSAYESLYLGVELINYIRNNAGGKGLSKANDLVEMNLDLGGVDVSNAGQSVDIAGVALEVFVNYASDKNFVSYAIENPKEAAGKAGLDFLGDVLKARNEAIDANNYAIEQIVTKLPEIVDSYTSGQTQLLRAIEITRALIEANRGFDKIYSSLYEEVFVNNDASAVSLKDIQLLTGAIKEFNSIAKSQL